MDFKINLPLLVYKIWYFLGISAMSITPFLSLYFKQLGLSPSQIGVATFVKYIGVAVFTPAVGLLIDRFQYRKLIIGAVAALWIGSCIIMGFSIPPNKEVSCKDVLEHNPRITQCLSAEMDGLEWNNTGTFIELHGTKSLVSKLKAIEPTSCSDFREALAADRSWIFDEGNLQRVFYIVLIGNSLIEMCFQPLHSIVDAESVNTLEELGIDISDYGKQRAFGSLGWGVA